MIIIMAIIIIIFYYNYFKYRKCNIKYTQMSPLYFYFIIYIIENFNFFKFVFNIA